MSTFLIAANTWTVFGIVAGVVAVILAVLYFLGKKMQKKQEESEATMRQGAQIISI